MLYVGSVHETSCTWTIKAFELIITDFLTTHAKSTLVQKNRIKQKVKFHLKKKKNSDSIINKLINSCTNTNIFITWKIFIKLIILLSCKLISVDEKPWVGLPLQSYSFMGLYAGHMTTILDSDWLIGVVYFLTRCIEMSEFPDQYLRMFWECG